MDDDLTPFGDGLPDELRRMLEQLTGPGGPLAGGLPGGLGSLVPGAGGAPDGPVDWRLARRVALQALDDDRSASEDERTAAAEALAIAELWLDAGSLPAPQDAGRLLLASRAEWVDAALAAMRPVVEPVAGAATDAMAEMARSSMQDLDLSAMGLGPIGDMLGGLDPGAMLRPMGASLAGLQVGQVLAELAGTLLHGTELGIPTGPRSTALLVAPTIADTFGDWELDTTEVLLVLCLHEAATRRLYHAVPWLESHVHELVTTFAEGTVVDPDALRRAAEEMMRGVDLQDPASLQEAMSSAGALRIEPTPAQRRVLERLQGVVALVTAWSRTEVERAAAQRLPALARIEEVLRRRRAMRADGDHLLAALLGLDLVPDDPTLGGAFVDHVLAVLGPDGLRTAIAHPENLPDLAELADPERWVTRVAAGDESVPDDLAGLLDGDGLADAPVEPSAAERLAASDDPVHPDEPTDDEPTDDGEPDHGDA